MSGEMTWKHFAQILCGVLCLSQSVLGSQPWIHMAGYQGDGIKLVCESDGWSSQPEVSWEDGKQHKLTAQTTTGNSANGLIMMQTSIIATESSGNMFSCLFIDSLTKKKTEGKIQIADYFFPRVSLGLVFCLLFFFIFLAGIGGVLFFIWKQQKKTKELNKELEELPLRTAPPNTQPLLTTSA
ncbi:butyrophilin subfamily 3 member A2-like [Callorhinchus milii]|uniref:butyrophilin subfamily 3 member A2-like n=1 Tax=Callorhinchus milii TaxID=7868 RepID=UPI001C3F5F6B|nr:butyrophilin subfamily 3 member A2-like [Callorhinchus milii]